MSIPNILSIDPGMMIGWAIFNSGEVVELGQVHLRDFAKWLESSDPQPELIVVEDFRLFKHLALQQSGSRIETAKCIGIVESYASRRGINVVLQAANILPIAEKWTGQKRPSKHEVGHKICAYLHGEYYLIKNNYKEINFS